MALSHKARFDRYRDNTVVDKSQQYAKWTLPQLMVTLQPNGTTNTICRDYQEVGALLTNNLAAKLAGILFPSSRPFFRITASDKLKKEAASKGITDSALASGLARLEIESCARLFINASYNQVVTALKHLIVTGNVLLYRDAEERKTMAYGLESFSIRRDGLGRMLDCVLREYTAFDALPEKVQIALRAKHTTKYSPAMVESKECNVELYTRIELLFTPTGSPVYQTTQEADDVPVGEPFRYPEHLCPWQAPMWSHISGENYGRGLVEDYAGGFAKLSDTSHALALYGIEALRVINLVAPGSGVDIDEIQNAETGEYVSGTKDAISVLETGSINKVQQALSIVTDLFGNLSKAFMYKGSTRNAERVTATELKLDAQEAEATLGGTYSSLAESMQIPFAHILLTEVNPGTLEGLVTGDMKLNIMAGIPALGRATDVQNLLEAAQEIAAILPVFMQLDKRIDPNKVIDLILAGKSVDTSMLQKTPEQLAEEQKAQAQAQQGQDMVQQSNALAAQSDQLKSLA